MARQKSQSKTKQVGARLNLDKPEEAALYDNIVAWKAQRRFTPMLRNAIRLIADLEAGNTDVLIELYPAVARLLANEHTRDDVIELARAVKELADTVKVSDAARQRNAIHAPAQRPTTRRASLDDNPLDTSDVVVATAKTDKGKAASNLGKGLMGFTM